MFTISVDDQLERKVSALLVPPDIASAAGAHWLRDRLGRAFGPSTGTNIIGALLLGQAMRSRGREGSIVTLAWDGGERYDETIYSPSWLAARGSISDRGAMFRESSARSPFPGISRRCRRTDRAADCQVI